MSVFTALPRVTMLTRAVLVAGLVLLAFRASESNLQRLRGGGVPWRRRHGAVQELLPAILTSMRPRGGRGEQDAWHGDGFVSGGGIRPSPRMFTGVREKKECVDRSPSGSLLAAMATSAEPETRTIKYIYIVSDSTGFTASHALTSCMTQFEDVAVDLDDFEVDGGQHADSLPTEARTQMFSNVNTWGRLERIIHLAAKMEAFIIYTLVNPHLNARMVDKCQSLNLDAFDLLGPLVITAAQYLKVKPSGLPRSSMHERRKPLSDKYFQRIEVCQSADAAGRHAHSTQDTPSKVYTRATHQPHHTPARLVAVLP
jgi:hypothetical protein